MRDENIKVFCNETIFMLFVFKFILMSKEEINLGKVCEQIESVPYLRKNIGS